MALDMRKMANFCDYFVICQATSDRRMRTIAEAIEEELSKLKHKPCRVEGLSSNNWILVDAGGVIVHIFEEETRNFYGLEHLWQEAPRVELKLA